MLLTPLIVTQAKGRYRKFGDALPLPLSEDASFSFFWKDFLASLLNEPERVAFRPKGGILETEPITSLEALPGQLFVYSPRKKMFYFPFTIVFPSRKTELVFFQKREKKVFLLSKEFEPPSKGSFEKTMKMTSPIMNYAGNRVLSSIYCDTVELKFPVSKEDIRIIGYPFPVPEKGEKEREYSVCIIATSKKYRGKRAPSLFKLSRFDEERWSFFLVFVEEGTSQWMMFPLVWTKSHLHSIGGREHYVYYSLEPTPYVLKFSFCIISKKKVFAVHEIDKGKEGFRIIADTKDVHYGIKCPGEKLHPRSHEEGTIFLNDERIRKFLGIKKRYPNSYNPNGIFISCGTIDLEEYTSLARKHFVGLRDAFLHVREDGGDIVFTEAMCLTFGQEMAYFLREKSSLVLRRYPLYVCTKSSFGEVFPGALKEEMERMRTLNEEKIRKLTAEIQERIREKGPTGLVIDLKTGKVEKKKMRLKDFKK